MDQVPYLEQIESHNAELMVELKREKKRFDREVKRFEEERTENNRFYNNENDRLKTRVRILESSQIEANVALNSPVKALTHNDHGSPSKTQESLSLMQNAMLTQDVNHTRAVAKLQTQLKDLKAFHETELDDLRHQHGKEVSGLETEQRLEIDILQDKCVTLTTQLTQAQERIERLTELERDNINLETSLGIAQTDIRELRDAQAEQSELINRLTTLNSTEKKEAKELTTCLRKELDAANRVAELRTMECSQLRQALLVQEQEGIALDLEDSIHKKRQAINHSYLHHRSGNGYNPVDTSHISGNPSSSKAALAAERAQLKRLAGEADAYARDREREKAYYRDQSNTPSSRARDDRPRGRAGSVKAASNSKKSSKKIVIRSGSRPSREHRERDRERSREISRDNLHAHEATRDYSSQHISKNHRSRDKRR